MFLVAFLFSFAVGTAASTIEYAPTTPLITKAALDDAPISTSTAKILIQKDAAKYGVSATKLYTTLQCESMGFTAFGQSLIPKAGGPNGREDSWGLAQIHLPDHPAITRQEAMDPAWAIDWAAQEFALGNAHWWTCYRLNFG